MKWEARRDIKEKPGKFLNLVRIQHKVTKDIVNSDEPEFWYKATVLDYSARARYGHNRVC